MIIFNFFFFFDFLFFFFIIVLFLVLQKDICLSKFIVKGASGPKTLQGSLKISKKEDRYEIRFLRFSLNLIRIIR